MIEPLLLTPAEYQSQKPQLGILFEYDIYALQIEELFEISHPQLVISEKSDQKQQDFIETYSQKYSPVWCVFPWSRIAVKSVRETDFVTLKSNRNQLLITQEEQAQLMNNTIGMLGLSIGGAMVKALVGSLHTMQMKIADFDELSTSNLNRVMAPIWRVGQTKASMVAQDCYELNPFVNLQVYDKGVNKENIAEFMSGLDIIFDEIDDFEMKVIVRKLAKEAGKVVVMLTNLGDSILIDIERFDEDPDRPIFHGFIHETAEEILSQPLTEERKKKYAVEIVGREHVPLRAIESLQEIGKTLVGRPQLLSSVQIASGLAPYVIRQIVLHNQQSGRYFLNLNDLMKESESQ